MQSKNFGLLESPLLHLRISTHPMELTYFGHFFELVVNASLMKNRKLGERALDFYLRLGYWRITNTKIQRNDEIPY